jgi:hypothetical protein
MKAGADDCRSLRSHGRHVETCTSMTIRLLRYFATLLAFFIAAGAFAAPVVGGFAAA